MQINENKFVCYTNVLYLCGLRDNNNHNLKQKHIMWIVETQKWNEERIKKIVASSNYEEIIEFVTMFYPLNSEQVEALKENGKTWSGDDILISISVIPYVIG